MTPPIASPHGLPRPKAATPQGTRATLGQWLYALSCVLLAGNIAFYSFDNTRSFVASLFPRDCSTGLYSTFTQAPLYLVLCFLPLMQMAAVSGKAWAKAPLSLMRFAVNGAFSITGALWLGMIALNAVRTQLR